MSLSFLHYSQNFMHLFLIEELGENTRSAYGKLLFGKPSHWSGC